MKCMKGHRLDVNEGMVILNRIETAFNIKCPICGAPGAIGWKDVAQIIGLNPKEVDKDGVIAEFKKRRSAGEPVAPVEVPVENESGIQEPQDSGEDRVSTGEDTMPEDEEPEQSSEGAAPEEEPIYVDAPPKVVPQIQPKRTVGRALGQLAASQGQQVQRKREVLIDEETAEITPRDILIAVIEDMGLPPTETGQLTEWVKLSVGTEWDPDSVKALCERFGLTPAVTTRATNRFRNQLEIRRMRQKRNEDLMDIAKRVGPAPVQTYAGFGGALGSAGVVPQGRTSTPFGSPGGSAVLPNQVQNDPCAAAVQAIINAAGGVITAQTLQQIDAVRAAFGQVTGNSMASPGQVTNNPMQMFQMMKELMEITERKKQGQEEEAKRQADLDKRFADMQNMIQGAVAAMSMNRGQVAVANPQETQNKMLLDTVLAMVKEKNQPPAVPAAKSREDMVFEEMFKLMMENMKGKTEQTVAPLHQEMAEIKDTLSRIGGGYNNLPTNPEQLHGIIDYTKAMAEIKKTDAEFSDKKANRELITSIAQGAMQTIGEAVASAFMQNPGTPEQKPVELSEQPVDDGSVVTVVCPKCGVPMTAPKGAAKIKCPNCATIFERAAHEKTREEAAEAEKLFIARQRQIQQQAAEEAARAAAEASKQAAETERKETAKNEPIRPSVPQPVLGPDAPKLDSNGKEMGPMSRVVLDRRPAEPETPDPAPGPAPVQEQVPAPEEETPSSDVPAVKNISESDEHPSEEQVPATQG
jgi:LSD1 subclass zinc finger protein